MTTLSQIGAWLRRRMIPILIVVAVILLVLFITSGAALPDDGDPIAVSDEAALAFVEKVAAQTGGAGEGKTVRLRFTEEEVTSFLNVAATLSERMREQGGTGDLDELDSYDASELGVNITSVEEWKELIEANGGLGRTLTDGITMRVAVRSPEVRFKSDGSIIVRGTVRFGFVDLPARLVFAPTVSDGELDLGFVEGQMGRLPIPGSVVGLIESGVERALVAGHDIGTVTRVTVGDGTIVFAGSLSR